MKVTYFLNEHKEMQKLIHTAASGEKSNHSYLITHSSCIRMLTKYERVTYNLSTSECMSSHSSKWREEQPLILNHTSCVRMLTKYESNLQAEYK